MSSKFKTLELSILRVGYIAKSQELLIKFNGNVVKGYDTLKFVNVDADTMKAFKNADDKDTFFEENIKHNFKCCADIYEMYEIFFRKRQPVMTEEERIQILEELRQAQVLKNIDSQF